MTEAQQAFHKLPRLEQRVRIMRDIVLQLNGKKLIARTGVYLHLFTIRKFGEVWGKPFEEVFMTTVQSCHVCAVGAAAVSAARLGNKATYGTMAPGDRDSLVNVLRPYFSARELFRIEQWFEVGELTSYAPSSTQTQRELRAWSKLVYPTGTFGTGPAIDDERRLRYIALSIIKHKGECVLPTTREELTALNRMRITQTKKDLAWAAKSGSK